MKSGLGLWIVGGAWIRVVGFGWVVCWVASEDVSLLVLIIRKELRARV